jgi:hypothetical protein
MEGILGMEGVLTGAGGTEGVLTVTVGFREPDAAVTSTGSTVAVTEVDGREADTEISNSPAPQAWAGRGIRTPIRTPDISLRVIRLTVVSVHEDMNVLDHSSMSSRGVPTGRLNNACGG